MCSFSLEIQDTLICVRDKHKHRRTACVKELFRNMNIYITVQPNHCLHWMFMSGAVDKLDRDQSLENRHDDDVD